MTLPLLVASLVVGALFVGAVSGWLVGVLLWWAFVKVHEFFAPGDPEQVNPGPTGTQTK